MEPVAVRIDVVQPALAVPVGDPVGPAEAEGVRAGRTADRADEAGGGRGAGGHGDARPVRRRRGGLAEGPGRRRRGHHRVRGVRREAPHPRLRPSQEGVRLSGAGRAPCARRRCEQLGR